MKKTFTFILAFGLIFLTKTLFAQIVQIPIPKSCYQYYSQSKQKHFYTTNFSELGNGKDGWQLEGVAFVLSTNSTTLPMGYNRAVHRYYSPGTNDAHYYTINFGVHPSTFTTYEGIEGYASATYRGEQDVAVYEYYRTSNGDYVYSKSGSTPSGYVLSGVAFYAMNTH